MIGNGLVRFHPEIRRKQDGCGLADTVWKTIQVIGPAILKDVALAGMKGLKEGVKGKTLIGKSHCREKDFEEESSGRTK